MIRAALHSHSTIDLSTGKAPCLKRYLNLCPDEDGFQGQFLILNAVGLLSKPVWMGF